MSLLSEIDEQPEALARLLGERRDDVARAAEAITRCAPEFVTIAARGSSDNAARYAQYVLGGRNGLAVALAVPSLHTLYAAPPRLGRALTVAISLSGQSPDVVAVVEDARKQGGCTLAITGDAASPLARAAEHVLLLACGEERSIAATKSYTNQLLAVAMLSEALRGETGALDAIPDAAREALRTPLPPLPQGDHLIVIGRGFHLSTANELALKLKETAYLHAEAYSPADLQHGPVALLDEDFPVASVGGPDPLATIVFPTPALPEWQAPIAAIIPGQRWAHAVALARGADPDRPRGLAKVTRTR